jgi:hypothetical protein
MSNALTEVKKKQYGISKKEFVSDGREPGKEDRLWKDSTTSIPLRQLSGCSKLKTAIVQGFIERIDCYFKAQ